MNWVSLSDIDASTPFPSGEVNFRLHKYHTGAVPVYLQRCHNGDDILKILFAADALRRAGKPADFFIPFLPNARQDRVCAPGEAFALKVVLAALRSTVTGFLYVFDCHCPVVEQMDEKVINLSPGLFQAKVLDTLEPENPLIVIPDTGAEKRLRPLLAAHPKLDFVQALKVRDREVTSVEVFGNVKNRNCVIFDDICDGGGTFIKLSEKLHAGGAKKVHLAVSHGIFSRGLNPLHAAGVTRIFTTTSFISSNIDNDNNLTTYNLEDIIL